MDKYLMQTPKSTQSRGRSKTDSVLSSNSTLLLDSTDLPPYRSRLHELFSLIDKEFQALYLENYQLRLRLGENADASLNELLKAHDQTLPSNDPSQKFLSGKKPSNWLPNKLIANLKNCRTKSYVGHNDAVVFVASCFQNGRNFVGSASADQTARVFDVKSGNCLLQLCHDGAVNSIAIHPDSHSQLILTSCGDKNMHLWKTNPFSDSNQATISSEDDLDDLDTVSHQPNEPEEHFANAPLVIRQPIRSFGHSEPVVGAEFLPGGTQAVSCGWDRIANIWDIDSDKVVTSLSGHENKLTFVSAHKTNKIVATASKDSTFRLWDFREAMRSVAIFQGHTNTVNSVVFNMSNQLISSGDDRCVKIWDLRNMRSPTASTRFQSSVNKVGTSKNQIAVPLDNRQVYILDMNGTRVCRIHRANGHHGLVEMATFVEDTDTNLITCSIDRQIIGWKVLINGK